MKLIKFFYISRRYNPLRRQFTRYITRKSLIVKDSELDEQLAIVKGVVNPNTIEVVDIL
jgi:hypothetical protein